MKAKTRPEDFQVEELTDVQAGDTGPFALYRLEKRGIGTPEALQAICGEWHVAWQRISYGGLKDRHANTFQYFTIRNGPQRNMRRPQFRVEYLGRTPTPFDPAHIRSNRFQIVLRDLTELAAQQSLAALEEVQRDGVANYFDDQRFGSVVMQGVGSRFPGGQEGLAPKPAGGDRPENDSRPLFVARKLIDGDYEAALRLALAEPYEFDRAAQKVEKRILRDHWGDWATAKVKLSRGHARIIATYLADHPTDFHGAIARLRADLKSLYLAAYQSYLWNRMLSRWLEQHCRPEQLMPVELRLGTVWFCHLLDEAQRALFHQEQLPLPSARLKINNEDPSKPLIDEVLGQEGLELAQMKLKHFREPFFAKGERAAFLIPRELQGRTAPDELHPGRQKLILSFELPRGCYATMVIKRLVCG